MSTLHAIYNARIPEGTKFPCVLPQSAWQPIEDEGRFIERLGRFPGIESNGPGSWMLWLDGEYGGEVCLHRMHPPDKGASPPGSTPGLGDIEPDWQDLVENEDLPPLLGLSVNMDVLKLVPLYNYMKRAFPGLLIVKDDSDVSYDAIAWEKWAKNWVDGGSYREDFEEDV